MARSGRQTPTASKLRIIGGQWRGRKLGFTPAEGLRPTSDRVRETLFNWLAPVVNGAHCLDLFAGSGALGLEALSRGAASCDFVERSQVAMRQIETHLEILQAEATARCHVALAQTFLKAVPACYDIVFIDPPFGKQLVEPVCAQLEDLGRLAANSLIYVEMAVREEAPRVPESWQLHRDKVAGEVAYRLFSRGGPSTQAG